MTAKDRAAEGQLPLSFAAEAGPRYGALPARIALPEPSDGHGPFDDEGYFFEPWWPGAHASIRREGNSLVLATEHLADPLSAFPELSALRAHLSADGLIVEGVILALDHEGRPDEGLLRRRLRAGAVTDEPAEGAFVATDLPYLEGESLARMPFVERRRRLAAALEDSDHCVLNRGIVGEGRMLGRAVASLGLPAISARRLDARWKSGPAGETWLRLPVIESPSAQTTPFLVLMERLPLGD